MKIKIFLVLIVANYFLPIHANGQQQKPDEARVIQSKYTGEIHSGRDDDRVFYEAEQARVYIDSNLDKKFGYLFQNGFVTGRYLFDLSDEEKCPLFDDEEFHGDVMSCSIEMITSLNNILVFRITTDWCDIASGVTWKYELKLDTNKSSEKDFKLIYLKFLGSGHP